MRMPAETAKIPRNIQWCSSNILTLVGENIDQDFAQNDDAFGRLIDGGWDLGIHFFHRSLLEVDGAGKADKDCASFAPFESKSLDTFDSTEMNKTTLATDLDGTLIPLTGADSESAALAKIDSHLRTLDTLLSSASRLSS